MARSQQFAFYQPMELFTINAFVVTAMKYTSQSLRKDKDVVIFPKVSRAARHRFIWIRVWVEMDYTHQTVNHSTNFVELGCGAHIQTIETFWHLYKMQNKRHCGAHSEKRSFYANTQWHEWISSFSVNNKMLFFFSGVLLQKILPIYY